ncbi:PepSY-associated TM helix domain-containing protein [Flavobacterium sp. '19STA2R22 D10 B1']|uniref:PepSY-associated TM helix domain-containing protein n=1 Tax=Flavobacterium aerium TaxID=3037261 RepID=UPI00278C838E|nr:PepSY-associated TM helix domain-containing protein [Flavobacterium sp. '19STA2R22 D10 B1']
MFNKINAWLHLWLGLASGIIVVIVSITGCILVFEQEIVSFSSPWLHVEEQAAEKQLPPSEIYNAVKTAMPDKEVKSLWYEGLDRSIQVTIDSDSLVYVNPYTAKIMAVVDHEDIFHIVEDGHFYLWLPREIGEQFTGWGTFIFFLLTISGLILWFPKKWNKANRDMSFKIKWKARFKRLNYDLHNVLGFYSFLLALIMAFTALVMSFNWFRQSAYWASGGWQDKEQKEEPIAVKDSITKPERDKLILADSIWKKVRRDIAEKDKEAVIISIQEKPGESIYACTDMHNGAWRDLYFDPQTLKLLPDTQKRIGDERFADWLRRSNYGLHTGTVGGLTTKILYFIASFICASLPITGFIIWWGRKKKKKKSPQKGKKAI